MSPYVELTEFAEIINKLAVKSNDSGMEVRCIMPRFGIINERRHRLHEVVRLSGINVSIDGDDYPLVIKVASLPNAGSSLFSWQWNFFKRNRSLTMSRKMVWRHGLRTPFSVKRPLKQLKSLDGRPTSFTAAAGWLGWFRCSLKPLTKRTCIQQLQSGLYHWRKYFKEKLETVSWSSLRSMIMSLKRSWILKDNNNISMFRRCSLPDAVTFGSPNIE